jgi:hypothetical protein
MNSVLTLRQRIILTIITLCTLFIIGAILAIVYDTNSHSHSETVRKHEAEIRGCEAEGGCSRYKNISGLVVVLTFAIVFVGYTDLFFIAMLIIISVGRFLEKLEQKEGNVSSA